MCGKNSSESSPNSQDNRDPQEAGALPHSPPGGQGQMQGGDQTGGHGSGHSRSYPNRVDDTGSDHMRGEGGDRAEKR